jgi:serine/threonine protein kinase
VTCAKVANDLLTLELPGLALGMALLFQETAAQNLVPLAEKACRLPPRQWPARLHEAKDRHAAGHWVEAADGILRVLLAVPEHWPACRAFSEVFSRPFEEDPARTRRVLDLAEAVVRYLQQRHRGGSPELLVLQAELRQHREGLGGRRLIRSGALDELNDLCVEATKLRTNFQPALAMLKQLRAADSMPIAEGLTFFNYQIEHYLGGGSFGQVYKATVLEPMPDRPATVALKFVRPDAPTDQKREQRIKSLRREAQIACRLDHPSIVRTYEFLDDRCLVMQYIHGDTLEDNIDRRVRYPWQRVARVGLQIAQALRYAGEVALEVGQGENHGERRSADFAHRDIHPKNIMVVQGAEGPHAYLLDFGLARLPGGTMTSLVKDVNKRLHYRDPLYPRGGFRGDMFSLGVILYELLCNEGPYPIDEYCCRDDGQPAEFDTQPKLVGQLLPQGVQQPPMKLQAALRKMVAFKAADRFASWDLLIDALTTVLDVPMASPGPERSGP